MPLSFRAALFLAAPSLTVVLIAVAGCAQLQPMPSDPAGRLFARSLDQISELYIVPVSSRILALDAATRLSELDPKLRLTETPGPNSDNEIVLNYGEQEAAVYPSPAVDDPHVWGGWIGAVEADAKRASPKLAAHPQDEIDKALFEGITSGLDRFSRYATPQAARDHRAARDGFGGIGVTLDDATDPLRITKVMPGGPADMVGIRVGDRIVAVDAKPTTGRSQNDVVRQLRGPVLSPVAIAVARPGQPVGRSFRLQRALIVLPTVTVKRENDIAVFHISGFNQNTTQQLVEDLEAMRRQPGPPLRGLVLDLRGDPGGLLDQAVSLADVFVAKGPIVATIGRNPAARQYFEASGDAVAPQLPIVVLINGGSASASEIVAAALQDSGRAVVVGTASYGKGTVQTVLRLPNDGELTLTWAELVAPAGYSLNGHGVVPTICTSDLGNDAPAISAAVQRAGNVSSTAPILAQPRASLDNRGWLELRRSCPARDGDRAIDMAVAERLLGDPALYSQAAHMISAAPKLAAKAVGTAPTTAGPVLTGVDGSLSSGEHYP